MLGLHCRRTWSAWAWISNMNGNTWHLALHHNGGMATELNHNDWKQWSTPFWSKEHLGNVRFVGWCCFSGMNPLSQRIARSQATSHGWKASQNCVTGWYKYLCNLKTQSIFCFCCSSETFNIFNWMYTVTKNFHGNQVSKYAYTQVWSAIKLLMLTEHILSLDLSLQFLSFVVSDCNVAYWLKSNILQLSLLLACQDDPYILNLVVQNCNQWNRWKVTQWDT